MSVKSSIKYVISKINTNTKQKPKNNFRYFISNKLVAVISHKNTHMISRGNVINKYKNILNSELKKTIKINWIQSPYQPLAM